MRTLVAFVTGAMTPACRLISSTDKPAVIKSIGSLSGTVMPSILAVVALMTS
jgi:hypothetical protein